MSLEGNKLLDLPIRQCQDKLAKLVEKISKEAADEKEIYQCVSIGKLRYYLNPALKMYVDLQGDFTKENFPRTVEKWLATQPAGTVWYKKPSSSNTSEAK